MTINPNHALSFPNKFQHHTRTNLSKKKNHGGNVVLSYKKKINKKTKQSFIIYFSQSTINNNYHNKYKRTREKKKKSLSYQISHVRRGLFFAFFFSSTSHSRCPLSDQKEQAIYIFFCIECTYSNTINVIKRTFCERDEAQVNRKKRNK